VSCLVVVLDSELERARRASHCVTGTMSITTFCYGSSRPRAGNWPKWQAVTLAPRFCDDLAFPRHALKIGNGGWVPLAIAIAIFTLMTRGSAPRHPARALTDITMPLRRSSRASARLHPRVPARRWS